MVEKYRNYLPYYDQDHSYAPKMKIIFNILLRPRRVYKVLLIFISAVILYVIVYHEEFSIDGSITMQQEPLSVENIIENEHLDQTTEVDNSSEIQNMKYILLWTPTVTPFDLIRKRGQIPFISSGCEYTNCFLTHRRRYFPDQTKFDAVVFSIAALKDMHKLPRDRSPRQKYVAASVEPPQNHPVVNPVFDGYFNWTWTYRLNSDVLWRRFRIFNSKKHEVGPRMDMKWLSDFTPRDYKLDLFLNYKKRAVVWIKTCCNCEGLNIIEKSKYISDLEKQLRRHGLSLATYSNCSGYHSCGSIIECSKLIQDNYYFYLAFEDYFDEDYVTEILLFAILNNAVPVVMGDANYSRFLPPGSYLDANKITAKAMAKKIDESMNDFTVYRQYFKWVSHYYYEPNSIESEVCNICKALNNKQMVKNVTVHKNFRRNWNGETSVLITDFLIKIFESDDALKHMIHNKNYSEIRKAFRKRHLSDPRDSVYVFDMDQLNLTSTEETNIMPFEFTSEVTNY